jgi:RNA polymerase sigma factor (sigma-70 family)
MGVDDIGRGESLMPGGMSREAFGDLRGLFAFGVTGSLEDGQLLDRFVDRRDQVAEDAFAALVERHGPMVLGVCRRILHHTQEAEDAFQATFLVLARKAATIARRETLASWLYGVALRTAKDARGRAARRTANEQKVVPATHFDPARDELLAELRSILDEELARLPDRFRTALLLCELEGLSRRDASTRLGIAEGTLSSRLARAKTMLRDRLVRRGLFSTTAGLSAALAKEAKAVAIPFALADSTTRAAALSAAGCSLAGLIPASTVSLSEEVLKVMLITKIKAVALGLIAVGTVAAGAVLAQSARPQRIGFAQPKGVEAAIVPDNDRLREVESKLDRILEALGRPGRAAATAKAHATARPEPEFDDVATVVEDRPATSPALAAVSGTIHATTDRIGTLERRLADVERRLAEIERRLKATAAPAALPPPTVATP